MARSRLQAGAEARRYSMFGPLEMHMRQVGCHRRPSFAIQHRLKPSETSTLDAKGRARSVRLLWSGSMVHAMGELQRSEIEEMPPSRDGVCVS